MPSLPDHVRAYSRTESFTHTTVPAALTSDHKTKPGTWAVINVLAGDVAYFIDGSDVPHTLTIEMPGIVAPGVPHSVALSQDASFFVEFYR